MGAQSFMHTRFINDKSVEQCFKDAQEEARYDHGHNGYTGSIAEKKTFIMMPSLDMPTVWEAANYYLGEDDPRINDKWGPAGCVKGKDDEGYDVYCFFGWASC
jgi:hypothetical protein